MVDVRLLGTGQAGMASLEQRFEPVVLWAVEVQQQPFAFLLPFVALPPIAPFPVFLSPVVVARLHEVSLAPCAPALLFQPFLFPIFLSLPLLVVIYHHPHAWLPLAFATN